jgi:ATP-dependent Clp protease protease subunit
LNTLLLEDSPDGEIPVNVYDELSHNRILFISGQLTDELATDIVATLLLKDSENSEKKITLFINSDGGHIRNAFMIHDMMKLISSPLETICMGSALDEAAIILASGTPGMRMATKTSVICACQLSYGSGVMTALKDAKKFLDHASLDNKHMMEILAKTCNKSIKQVSSDFDRRVFMSPAQALKYGLIDRVIKCMKCENEIEG